MQHQGLTWLRQNYAWSTCLSSDPLKKWIFHRSSTTCTLFVRSNRLQSWLGPKVKFTQQLLIRHVCLEQRIVSYSCYLRILKTKQSKFSKSLHLQTKVWAKINICEAMCGSSNILEDYASQVMFFSGIYIWRIVWHIGQYGWLGRQHYCSTGGEGLLYA